VFIILQYFKSYEPLTMCCCSNISLYFL